MTENMKDENKAEESANADVLKQWIQDNLRIIVSVAIVVLIAGGIYSYSKRSESPLEGPKQVAVEETEEPASTEKTVSEKKESKQVSAASSQETEASFIETAGKGDSSTVLARRALANYLEKNPDAALTAEHKIYLRKNVSTKKIEIGTSVEFSKDLIQKSIEKSKTLNDQQLENLKKYSARVTSLS